MNAAVRTRSSTRAIARRDRVYAAHLFLCASLIAWHVFDATPGLAPAQDGAFAGSPLGIASTMITLGLGVASVVGVFAWTISTRTDVRLWLLLVLMSLSMVWRRDIDVFDITYMMAAAILSVWWFNAGRARMKSASFAEHALPGRTA